MTSSVDSWPGEPAHFPVYPAGGEREQAPQAVAPPHAAFAALSPLLRAVDRLITHAARQVQVLATVTPLGAKRERARLVGDLASGRPARPRWSYARASHGELRRALEAAESELARRGSGEGLEALYLARVQELSLEAALCEAAGSTALATLANQRYAPGRGEDARAAADLSASWIALAPAPGRGVPLLSDSPHPASLLSRMKAAVGDLRLPFAVLGHAALASLAATGEHAVFVAIGRAVYEEDAVRTVLHEIEGHARPRARAMKVALGLFGGGTARGVDDQEGRALVLEERAGLLTARRRRQLAARHRAVLGMLAGGTFSDVAFALVREHGFEPEDAVLIAERAFRGGDGTGAGLGRERVYLESFLRVGAHLARHPEDDDVLAAGQIAAGAARAMRQAFWAERAG